jgi:2-polyprenyl-3-methyl-5-hydroxy-6-metoxy-1,4-benzoquinol methylase
MISRKNTIGCRICENANENKLYNILEMMFGTREVFIYMECSSCGCLQLIDIPSDMSKHYPEGYYSFSLVSPEQKKSFKQFIDEYLINKRDFYALTGKSWIGKFYHDRYFPFKETYTFKSVYPFLRKIGIKKKWKILDVGCGNGKLLYHLTGIGFKETLGVDFYVPKNIQYKNGLKILKKTIFEIGGAYDLIMLNHCFEHMDHPLTVLQAIHRLLKAGGTCMIRIPTVSSYAWKHYRKNWVQIDAPRHFFLHSIRSMEILCAHAGLYIDDIIYDAMSFQFWGSEQYAKDIPLMSEESVHINPDRSFFSSQEMEAFNARTRELNEKNSGDQAAFFLKKMSPGCEV